MRSAARCDVAAADRRPDLARRHRLEVGARRSRIGWRRPRRGSFPAIAGDARASTDGPGRVRLRRAPLPIERALVRSSRAAGVVWRCLARALRPRPRRRRRSASTGLADAGARRSPRCRVGAAVAPCAPPRRAPPLLRSLALARASVSARAASSAPCAPPPAARRRDRADAVCLPPARRMPNARRAFARAASFSARLRRRRAVAAALADGRAPVLRGLVRPSDRRGGHVGSASASVAGGGSAASARAATRLPAAAHLRSTRRRRPPPRRRTPAKAAGGTVRASAARAVLLGCALRRWRSPTRRRALRRRRTRTLVPACGGRRTRARAGFWRRRWHA